MADIFSNKGTKEDNESLGFCLAQVIWGLHCTTVSVEDVVVPLWHPSFLLSASAFPSPWVADFDCDMGVW